jgi:hypothetical protein
MIKAKSVLKNKFWIMEDDGVKIGTLHKNDDDQKYMYTCDTGTTFYETEKDLKTALGNITWSVGDVSKDKVNKDKELYGYPTSTLPFNTMYDVQRRLPLFTKSAKSKSVYCAGYYIIRFDKGWVRSFCPKSVTIEKYPFKGPFKSELTMRTELSNANRADQH